MSHLIRSPVNGMIISWGYENVSFPRCALPRELQLQNCECIQNVCKEDVILDEELSRTDWYKFIPETGLGISNFNLDVASSLIRDAAIELCKRAKCLQRKFRLYVQKDIHEYPLQSVQEERPIAVLCAMSTDYYKYDRANHMLELDLALTSKNTLSIASKDLYKYNGEYIDVVMAYAPTEESDTCDMILYDEFKKAIVLHARRRYLELLGYGNDRLLQLTTSNMQEFNLEIARAKDKTHEWLHKSNRKNYSIPFWS